MLIDKCIICDRRPQKVGLYCGVCAEKLKREAETRDERKESASYYITWKGIVVGLYKYTDDVGIHYRPRLEYLDIKDLPKSRTIDINVYVPGYDRKQISKFKATCLQLSGFRG